MPTRHESTFIVCFKEVLQACNKLEDIAGCLDLWRWRRSRISAARVGDFPSAGRPRRTPPMRGSPSNGRPQPVVAKQCVAPSRVDSYRSQPAIVRHMQKRQACDGRLVIASGNSPQRSWRNGDICGPGRHCSSWNAPPQQHIPDCLRRPASPTARQPKAKGVCFSDHQARSCAKETNVCPPGWSSPRWTIASAANTTPGRRESCEHIVWA
jgi:hypothetical protein